MKNLRFLLSLFLASALSARAATALESGEFFVDLRESPRVARASEPLAYSTRWAGVDALAGCSRKARLLVAGYNSAETLADVPVLVRLSTAIQGFDYNDFAAPVTGADLVFCDESETTVYPHEIDEWNTNGESLVWVRLPALAAGTAFKMGYGGTPATAAEIAAKAHSVWSDYAGVWHMNEDSGTAFDSTANGLDGVPSKGTNTLADVSQMVAFENGACGRARVNATTNLGWGPKMVVPSYDSLNLGSTFVFSGWFFVNEILEASYPKLVFRNWDYGGWGLELCRYSDGRNVSMVGGAGSSQNGTWLNAVPFQTPILDGWKYITAVYNGSSGFLYENGILLTNGVITVASDNGNELIFGGASGERWHSLNGQYDEIRLLGGTLSAARIRADYDMIANPGFVTCGAVEAASGGAVEIRLDGEVFAGPFSGEGTASWTPAKPGTYEFEHVSLVDGTPVAVESASFEVPGPADDDLSIVAEGDLVEGVSVRLGGMPDGWTIHYTTDGSAPTADSPAYTGPFALAESATVKAVAVNDELGWMTGVAEQRFDLAPPLAVTGAQARQRYPWNGLVDVDFLLAGDTAKCYRVSLDVTDLDGGTNLAARMVWEDGDTLTNAVLDVAPGTHRFVWNAGADLPEGFVADRVAVSLRAEAVHDTALYMVVDLSGGPNATHYPVSYLPDVPEDGWTDEYKTEKLVLRRVEPGWFTMGRKSTDYPTAQDSVLRVTTLSRSFYLGVFETTQGQWENLGETTTGQHPGSERPAYGISYDYLRGADSAWPESFAVVPTSVIGKIRAKTLHLGFDLPTEAQWEYACRAGTEKALHSGKNITAKEYSCANVSEVGRFCGNSGWRWNSAQYETIANGTWDGTGEFDKIAIVGSYAQNAWGLYDMHGNVWEWCLDWMGSTTADPVVDPIGPSTGTGRIVRGGSWNSDPWEEASGERRGSDPSNETRGFRLFLHNAPAVVEAPIMAPVGLMATTNRTGDVTLAWDPVAGAYAYQIRRSKTGAFENGTWLNTVTNTTYADWTAEARTDYTYWVRAQFESGKVGRWSEGAEGCRSKRYTVHFDANGGTGTMGDIECFFDQSQALPANAFTKSGNVFTGWATNATGVCVYADGETVENLTLEPGAIVTLYACWATSTYTVKFNKNASAATGTMADQTMTRNANTALRANAFVRAGYKFAGWATSASGAKVYNDKQTVKNITTGSSITLYAVWEALTAQNALYMVIDLSGGANASSYPVSYLSAVPSGGWTDTYKTTKLVLRRCEAGTFKYQGTTTKTISKAFYIGVFEMTQKQYSLVMGNNPSGFSGDKRPVEKVSYTTVRGSWNAIGSSSFLYKLRTRAKLDFDLPTEVQWEYACRAGTTTTYSYGNSANGAYMWYSDNSSSKSHDVGTKKPNPWGLYDMHGNEWEWCVDDVSSSRYPAGTYMAVRGGSWLNGASMSASSYRNNFAHADATSYIGFRVVWTLNQ